MKFHENRTNGQSKGLVSLHCCFYAKLLFCSVIFSGDTQNCDSFIFILLSGMYSLLHDVVMIPQRWKVVEFSHFWQTWKVDGMRLRQLPELLVMINDYVKIGI